MKKFEFVLIVVLFLINFFVKGQSQETYPCELLKNSIESDIFKTSYYVCKYVGEDLPIVDLTKKFQHCKIDSICERRVVVCDSSIIDKSKKNIFLFRIDKKKKIYTLYFVKPTYSLYFNNYPYNGNTVTLKFKLKKNNIELLNTESGAF